MTRLSATATVKLFLAALAVVLVASLVIAHVGGASHDQPDLVCRHTYDQRIGHDLNDNAFWLVLQDCARRGQLPDGANDPGYYQ